MMKLSALDWIPVLLLIVVFVGYKLLRRAGLIASKVAVEHLRKGAVIIDVRSATEFGIGHLPRAINVPLDEVEELLPRRVKDKDRVILMHCQTGARSGMAKKKAGNMGYAQAFNLGSYDRAARIVSRR
jgi:rhodanese-related sulfurtransferase